VAEAGLRNVTFTLAPLPETTSAFEGHREELVGDKGYHIGAVLGKPGERRSANIYFREAGEEETALGKQGRAEAGYLNDRGQQGRSKVLLEVQLPLTIVRKIISC
jgi:hypothetical protein